MRHWLVTNWFKVAILTILIVAIGLGFVYATRQQKLETQQQILELNSACQKLASQKKTELTESNSDLDMFFVNTYVYKYNPKYGACIVAYTGSHIGSLANSFGHDVFEVDNLSTGESLMSSRVNPGTAYADANTAFKKMEAEYIGSTAPID